jgi:FAD/FMN-containing dehydrogenase
MSDTPDPQTRKFRLRRRAIAAALGLGAIGYATRKIYQLGAPPDGERICDLTYPALNARPAQSVVTPPFALTQRGGTINDASCLNRTPILGTVSPTSVAELQSVLSYARANGCKVSAAGMRHSMGGQSFGAGGLVVDTHALNTMALDASNRLLTVGAGATWSAVLHYLDERKLAVKAMQSISIFTVGGTLSVNAHGVAHSPGSVAHTVRSMRVMLADGAVVNTSATENRELFRHVLGGYGLVALILDAQIEVVDNDLYRPLVDYVDYTEFPAFFEQNVRSNRDVGLFYARLSVAPSAWLREASVHSYVRIAGPEQSRPIQPDTRTRLERTVFNFSKTGSLGRWVRWKAEANFDEVTGCPSRNQAIGTDPACRTSRNQQMDDTMGYLRGRLNDTDILQEYFIPPARFAEFVDGLRAVVERERANLLNATIRGVEADTITALPYAPRGAFAIVLYFNQALNVDACRTIERTTVALIDLAISLGGRFYLPYQLSYSGKQLRAAYPEIDAFFKAKRIYDPAGVFSNRFYEKYAADT